MTDIETLRWTARKLLPKRQSAWLAAGMEMLRLDFAQIGEEFPEEEIRILVDWPYRRLGNDGWQGQYQQVFHPIPGHEIFINPTSTSLLALDTLVHELIHAIVQEPGHGDRFREVATAIGLTDEGTASCAEEDLMQRLIEIRNILGPYPLVTDCLEEA